MVNVINNSVLHSYNGGANTSVFFTATAETKKQEYEEIVAQILNINKAVPCDLYVDKKSRAINVSFAYKTPLGNLESAKVNLDFQVGLRTTEEFDLCFSNIYQYIVQEIGYSVSDYFKASDNMPFISEQGDSLYVHLKPKMLTLSFEDLFGNKSIIINYIKEDDYE
jgi:hypothetical protein